MNDKITKVICKKNVNEGGNFAIFREGIEYSKFEVETEEISKLNPISYTYKYIYIYSAPRGGCRFHLDKNLDNHIIFHNFYDYFYDNNELRKLKLNKINNI